MKIILDRLTVYERMLVGVFLVLTLVLAALDFYFTHREAVEVKVVRIADAR